MNKKLAAKAEKPAPADNSRKANKETSVYASSLEE